jgi:hypothetical protein
MTRATLDARLDRLERRRAARAAAAPIVPPVVICEPGETVAECADRLHRAGRTRPALIVPAEVTAAEWESYTTATQAAAAEAAAEAAERFAAIDDDDTSSQHRAAVEAAASVAPLVVLTSEPSDVRIVRIGR